MGTVIGLKESPLKPYVNFGDGKSWKDRETDKLPPAEALIGDIQSKAATLQELEKRLPVADEEQKQKQEG